MLKIRERTLYRAMAKHGICWTGVSGKRGKRVKLTRDKYLVPEEFKRLLYAARTRPHKHALRDLAFLATACGVAARCGEATALRIGDVIASEIMDEGGAVRPITILRVCAEKKREHPPHLPTFEMALPNDAAKILRTYIRSLPESDRHPWCRLFRFSTRMARKLFKTYTRIAGLNPRYSFHSLRHSRLVQVYALTRDAKKCQAQARHANLAATEPYIHLVDALGSLSSINVGVPEDPSATCSRRRAT